jgi:RodZ C-terminal domain
VLSTTRIMWVFAVLLVLSVLVAFVVRRRDPASRDSVDQQRQRLDALRAAVGAADDDTVERRVAPVARPIVPSRATRSRRSRSGVPPVVLVVLSLVVVVAGVVLVAGLVGDGGGDTAAEQPTTGTRADATSSSTSTTTTTTRPAATVVGQQGSTITVAVPSAPYTVMLNARAACWMRAEGPDGQEIETTTLEAGAAHPIAATGPMTLRLGNPGAVDVAVDGQALALPLPKGSAVDVKFVPPGSPT